MSIQSPASTHFTKISSFKSYSLTTLLVSSAISLVTIGSLTGCQTTEGLSSPSSVPTIQITPQDKLPSSSPVGNIDEVEDDYPISDTDSMTESPTTPHTYDPTIESVDQPTQEQHETEPSVVENAVEQVKPNSPVIPNSQSEVYIAKPPVPDAKTTQQILLDQARQNSKNSGKKTNVIQDGSNIPAFQKLMDTGVEQLRQGQVSAAQATFTRAQRLAPQSSAVYFYLGQVALKQNQPLKAEAMARRGLVVAKTDSRKRALWQVILKAGQAQGNTRVINEAKAALSR